MKFNSEKIENFLGRILYFHNTIDTHFIVMGILGLAVFSILHGDVFNGGDWFYSIFYMVLAFSFLLVCFKIADFHAYFLIATPIFLYLFFNTQNFDFKTAGELLLVNIALFFVSQFLLYGVPYIVILKDISTPFRIAFNSLLTVTPTTSSALVSIYFTSFFTHFIYFKPNPANDIFALWLFTAIIIASVITRYFLPETKVKVGINSRPKNTKPLARRVIFLNIDGCQLERFERLNLPFIESLKRKYSYFKYGASTVYRGLTNPAFASILTGAPPRKHGMTDNNLGRKIVIEALPDIVDTIIYGCIHVKQFAKPQWKTKIISLPRYGFRSDDVLFEMLKADISTNKAKLFIADLSDVDMAGHAYGSYSAEYALQLRDADERIAAFFSWLEDNKLLDSSVVFITSDHGMAVIDHVYLLWAAEKYVPLILCGAGIKREAELFSHASILDFAPTISYILGLEHLKEATGRVLTEALDINISVDRQQINA